MICCIDGSNIIGITFAIAKRELQKNKGMDYEFIKEDVPFFYHIFMKKIVPILSTYKNCIFCFEGLHSTAWRKSVYPAYKANRDEKKQTQDFKVLKDEYQNIEKFLHFFRCKTLRVELAEADDLIYKICELESKSDDVVVISNDKDFVQLLNFFSNIRIYNPIKKVFEKNNENILLEKSLIGDVSDNIKGIPGVGEKVFQKMLADKALWNKKMTQENIDLQKRILQIIDLRNFPKHLQENIEVQYKTMEWNKFDK
ncbi:MAG: hypothetical protein LBF97_03475, partial [Elusimicrobiota bacterium]|nr:hypothetical protein [Elusimicrobiota bacterium]